MKKITALYLTLLLVACSPTISLDIARPAVTASLEATTEAEAASPLATDAATATPETQPTLAPTATLAEPTVTEPPKDPNPKLQLPFSDNFDSGLSNQWRILSGQPLIDKGRLTSTNELAIEIGNTSLQNYTVEFDVSGSYENECGFGYGSTIEFQVNPSLYMSMDYNDFWGRGEWYAFVDEEWEEISSFEGWDCGKVKLDVRGASYALYVNGQLFSDLIWSEPVGSPLVIRISQDSFMDNLTIQSN